jgi:hypothetical protein
MFTLAMVLPKDRPGKLLSLQSNKKKCRHCDEVKRDSYALGVAEYEGAQRKFRALAHRFHVRFVARAIIY